MRCLIQNEAGKLDLPFSEDSIVFSRDSFELYKQFNKEKFSEVIEIPSFLEELAKTVIAKHRQSTDLIVHEFDTNRGKNLDNRKVIIGFSSGLDSVYQAICLLEKGYDVTLFFLKNINTYENGQSTKAVDRIFDILSTRFNSKVHLLEASISKNSKKENEWRQHWPENPIKNQLILSIMADYALQNEIGLLSLGDDFGLSIDDAVLGINLTDAREMTQSFLKGLSQVCELRFMKVDRSSKLERLMKLSSYNLLDEFYSCVQAGRFNKMFHEKAEKKFNVKLFAHNCGCYCRKCAMHNLLLHYGHIKRFSDEFVDACWKVMWKNSYSSDYEFFKPELSIEERVKNLFEY